MSVICYLLLAICYSLSNTCYLKLATSCKNLIPFAPVVRLALVYLTFVLPSSAPTSTPTPVEAEVSLIPI